MRSSLKGETRDTRDESGKETGGEEKLRTICNETSAVSWLVCQKRFHVSTSDCVRQPNLIIPILNFNN